MDKSFRDEELFIDIGSRLKVLREAKGLKQREMAEILGIQTRRYQRFEYGEVNMPLSMLVFFADFFNVTTDYLLGRENK